MNELLDFLGRAASADYSSFLLLSNCIKDKNKEWRDKFLSFFHFQPSVRFEACRGLYRLSLIKENSCLIQLMDALLDSLPLAQSLQSKENTHGRRQEAGAREYFSILCRLVDGLPTLESGQKVQHVY